MKKEVTRKFLKQLEETIDLHRADFRFRVWEFKKVLKEKKFVVKVLTKERPTRNEIKKALKLLTEWQKTHVLWKRIVKIEKPLVKDGGSVAWHNKWIKVYDQMKRELTSPESRPSR